MNEVEQVLEILQRCSPEQRRQVFDALRKEMPIHRYEEQMNAKAEVILEALARAPELTTRGVRGIIGEATFAIEIAANLLGWQDVTPPGNHAYDTALKDTVGVVHVQVKMQRRKKGLPWIKRGTGIVEVQRTRSGLRKGEKTRPYRFGEFDILAVCMEPSHRRWTSFLYAPERWLLPRPDNPALVMIHQPVPLVPDRTWADDFEEAVSRHRSGETRPAAG